MSLAGQGEGGRHEEEEPVQELQEWPPDYRQRLPGMTSSRLLPARRVSVHRWSTDGALICSGLAGGQAARTEVREGLLLG